MRTRKKRIGSKAQIRATKEKERHVATAIFLAIILITVVFSAYFTYAILNQPQNQTTNVPPNPALDQTSDQSRAAIVDQLSLACPNQAFKENATCILKEAEYTVDYYPGENVTVDLYRNLPARNYKVIVFRVHSSATNPDMTEGPVTLFTSELYDQSKHIYEQLSDQLRCVAYSKSEWDKGIMYFGIYPPFIERSMRNRYNNTVVIMMGCDGLRNTGMAEEFIEKGAMVYISWKDPVLTSRTDQATACLLHHLIQERQTINQAVENTMKEMGPDPTYHSTLAYWPFSAGKQTIEDIKNHK